MRRLQSRRILSTFSLRLLFIGICITVILIIDDGISRFLGPNWLGGLTVMVAIVILARLSRLGGRRLDIRAGIACPARLGGTGGKPG